MNFPPGDPNSPLNGGGGNVEPITMTCGGPYNDRAFDVLVTEDRGLLIAGLANNTRLSHRWSEIYSDEDEYSHIRGRRIAKILLIEPAKAPRTIGGEDVFLYKPLALEYLAAGVSKDHALGGFLVLEGEAQERALGFGEERGTCLLTLIRTWIGMIW